MKTQLFEKPNNTHVFWFSDVVLVDLLGLLNWRSNPEDLDQILLRLMEVEGGEIVKVISHFC